MRINSLIYKIRYLLISFLPNKIRRAIFNVLVRTPDYFD